MSCSPASHLLPREARLLAAAVQTLTRIPVASAPPGGDWLARSAKYYPLVGAAVGAVAGLGLAAAAYLWPAPVPALLAVAVAMLVTGALHEDGLADAADGAGGATRERRLAIMKDPRLGAFGALALGLTLALKVAVLSTLPVAAALPALVAGGAVSRFWAVVVMSRSSYAGERSLARLDHGIEGPRRGEVAFSLALALVPLFLMGTAEALGGLAASAAAAALAAAWLCRGLGGYTGDILGAVIAVSETAFLLGAAARLP